MSEKKIGRNLEIVNLIKQNQTFTSIGNKFNISKARVQQIAKTNDISVWNNIRKVNEKYHKNILNDINNQIPYSEILSKYKIPKSKLLNIFNRMEKESLPKLLRTKRNDEITKQFTTGYTAKKITNNSEPSLKSPIKITSVDYIYRINVKQNIRRFPQINDRHKGGLFESKEVIKLIKKRKDKDNWTFKKIVEELNNLGHKTITGKPYTIPNTRAKYLALKDNKKIRN